MPSAPSAPSRSTSVEKRVLRAEPVERDRGGEQLHRRRGLHHLAGVLREERVAARERHDHHAELSAAHVGSRSSRRDRSASAGAPRGDVHALEAAGAATRPRVVRREVRLTGAFARERERLDDCAPTAAGSGARPASSDSAPDVASRAAAVHVMTATRARRARTVKKCIAKNGGGKSRSKRGGASAYRNEATRSAARSDDGSTSGHGPNHTLRMMPRRYSR